MKKLLPIALALLLLAGCSAKPSTSEPSVTPSTEATPETSSPSESEAQVESPTPAMEAPAAPSEEPPVETAFAIGDTATLGDWEINVTEFEFTTNIKADYGSFSPEDGNQYGVAYVSVTNTGKESGRFLPSIGMNDDVQAKILYGDGYEFSAANLLGHSDDLHDSALNPLTSKNGLIAFQLPQTVADSTDPLTLVFSAGKDKVTFTLR